MKNRLALVTIACAAVSVRAAVSFEPAKNFPHLGLMLPRLSAAKGDPVPMPQAHAYLIGDGEELACEDRFDPYELWFNAQCCARWRDAAGNRLMLGRMTTRLPAFGEVFVSRAAFAQAMADEDWQLDPDSDEQVNEWVATFVDEPVYAPEKLKINAFTLGDVLRYPCGEKGTLVYAFRPRRIGSAPSLGWYCLVLRAPGETDDDALRDQFEERFIGAIDRPPATSKSKGVSAKEVEAETKRGQEETLVDHPVRTEAKKSVENYDDWWFAETSGYVILSDVATQIGKTVVRDLQQKLPVLRQGYARLVPPLTAANEVSLVRLFASRDDYVRYVGSENAWTGGMWMPARRELVLFLQSAQEDQMRIIRHEAFHQYLSYATCMMSAAPWLNEGHACLFESSRVDAKGKLLIEEDAERALLLTQNLDLAVELLPLLLMDTYETFYAGETPVRRMKYALAWGFAYYLQKGVPLERESPAASIMVDYLADLAESHDRAAATATALAPVEMAVLQDRFRQFWAKGHPKAKAFDPLD